MANQLDELNPQVMEEGLDTNVIVKKLPADKKGTRGKRKVKIETNEAPVSEWKERVVLIRWRE